MAGRRTCGAVQAKTRPAKYAAQRIRTEANRKRKQAKHQRMVEKKAAKKLSFNLWYI